MDYAEKANRFRLDNYYCGNEIIIREFIYVSIQPYERYLHDDDNVIMSHTNIVQYSEEEWTYPIRIVETPIYVVFKRFKI